MNTPTHVIVSLLSLVREDKARIAVPVIVGAVLPDLAMVGFYAFQKLVKQTPESVIWGELYHASEWQALFDVFNSLPILAVILVIAWRAKLHWLLLLSLSMTIHVLLDLPVHREDAHHHFYPLSDWAFFSPISYWDPCHYGSFVTAIEVVILALGCGWILWRFKSALMRATAVVLLVVTVAYGFYVMTVWSGGSVPQCQSTTH